MPDVKFVGSQALLASASADRTTKLWRQVRAPPAAARFCTPRAALHCAPRPHSWRPGCGAPTLAQGPALT